MSVCATHVLVVTFHNRAQAGAYRNNLNWPTNFGLTPHPTARSILEGNTLLIAVMDGQLRMPEGSGKNSGVKSCELVENQNPAWVTNLLKKKQKYRNKQGDRNAN